MSKVRLRYVQAFVDRKTGAVFHYFRRRGCKRVRLPGLPGSAEFMEAYRHAIGQPPFEIGAGRTKAGTINAALVGYYNSLAFRGLKPRHDRCVARSWNASAPSMATDRSPTCPRSSSPHAEQVATERRA